MIMTENLTTDLIFTAKTLQMQKKRSCEYRNYSGERKKCRIENSLFSPNQKQTKTDFLTEQQNDISSLDLL